MTKQAEILQEIKAACTLLFTRISEKRVSEDDTADTELPALIISEVTTVYSKQVDNNAVEDYDIKLMIMLEDGGESSNPLSDLSEKQNAVISAMLHYKPLMNLLGKDGLVLKDSTASNSLVAFQKGSAVMCILSIICDAVVPYKEA